MQGSVTYKFLNSNSLKDLLIHRESVNQIDKSCHNALTSSISHCKWAFVKELLVNLGLKNGDPLQEDTLEGTIDVHAVNDEGHSALTMLTLAR